MSRSVLVAWIGAGVAAAAILAALFWPMTADVAPASAPQPAPVLGVTAPPAAVSPLPTAAALRLEAAATTTRPRVAPTNRPAPIVPAQGPVAAPAAPAPPAQKPRDDSAVVTTAPVNGDDGGGGDNPFGEFFEDRGGG